MGSIWGQFGVIFASGASLGCPWAPWGVFWASWGGFGASWGVLGASLGRLRGVLGRLWGVRERQKCGLGSPRASPWTPRGAPTRRLPSENESSFFVFGVPLGRLGVSFARLGAALGRLGASLGRLWGVFGASWGVFGASLGRQGLSGAEAAAWGGALGQSFEDKTRGNLDTPCSPCGGAADLWATAPAADHP